MIKNILAFDVGKTSLGIAISRTGFLVSPVANLRFKNLDYSTSIEFIKDLLKKEYIENFVIGLPLFPSGDECEMTSIARNFADILKRNFPNIDQYFQDERYSTIEASEILHQSGANCKKQGKKIDETSSCVILERFLKKVNQI